MSIEEKYEELKEKVEELYHFVHEADETPEEEKAEHEEGGEEAGGEEIDINMEPEGEEGTEEKPETELGEAKDKKWIQKAVNPEHKGYCTPMTKSTCTPERKALAKRFKKGI